MALHINTFSFSTKSANVLRTSVGEVFPGSGSGQVHGHSQGAPSLA